MSRVHCLFLDLSCVQVFIQGNAEQCDRVLKTILDHRRLCPLLSPFFTPNAAPRQLVVLYQDVVTSLQLDRADVIFMLLTKVSPDTSATWKRNVDVCCSRSFSPCSLICATG